jgi:hypothetical protein
MSALALLFAAAAFAQAPVWGVESPTPPAPVAAPAPAATPWGAPAAAPAVAAPVVPVVVAAPKLVDTRIDASLVVRVNDRDAAAQAMVDTAQGLGGWFSNLSENAVTVRVPVDSADLFLGQAQTLGEVVDRSFSRSDMGPQKADVESRLKARREVLERYLGVLADASPKAVVQVEREITRVVSEIEGLEGQKRVLEDRTRFAEVTVGFRFRARRAPRRDGSSSFAWLNTVNVADMLDDMETGFRAPWSRAVAPTPAGFAPFKRQSRFQAVSPDDVAYRVRSARNKPTADLTFWSEALKSRMVAAGYHVISEQAVTAVTGQPGAVLELGAANGEQDQTYLVAIFVRGRHLVIAEATGEAERFRARRGAILAAVSGLEL